MAKKKARYTVYMRVSDENELHEISMTDREAEALENLLEKMVDSGMLADFSVQQTVKSTLREFKDNLKGLR